MKARCEMEVERIEKQFDDCIAFLLRVFFLFSAFFFCQISLSDYYSIDPCAILFLFVSHLWLLQVWHVCAYVP